MALESESGQEKSEEPTGRRLSQARTEGQVARSMDLGNVTGITATFIALQYIAPWIWRDIQQVSIGALSYDPSVEPLTVSTLQIGFLGLLKALLPEMLLLIFISAFFGAGIIAIQTNFLWSSKLLKPKFSQLNPIKGIKRLFSAQNAVNLLKSVAKLCIIGPIAYFAFFDLFHQFLGLMDVPLTDLLPYTAYAASYIFWRIISLLLVLAILDYCWQRFNNKRQLKMTKEEVKDEKKSIEGDEKTKMQIRAKALARARERMMQNVPTADVVVTNPTHLAVALRYDMSVNDAPQVVAKGRGYVAERIRKIARENGVPVIERKPLARALFKTVEVGQSIPYELFAAVAEILAYVYKLRNRNPFRNRPRTAQSSSGTKKK